MMQLFCNGRPLDLYENSAVQFTQENPIFSFDNLKCERTTQLKIPKTSTNDEIFALSRIPATRGEGMRRKFDAKMILSGITKEGYLYVSNYNGKDYAAIFVTGEFVALQRAKDAGKIKDIITPNVTTLWGNPVDANTARTEVWKCIKYMQEKRPLPIPIPSYRLKYVLDECAAALGFNLTLPSAVNYLRIIPAKLKEYSASGLIVSQPNIPASSIMNQLLQYDRLFEPCEIVLNNAVGESYYWQDAEPPYVHQPEQRVNFTRVEQYGKMQGLRAKMDLILTFNSDAAGYFIYTNTEFYQSTGYEPYGAPSWARITSNLETTDGALSGGSVLINGNVTRFEREQLALPNPDYEQGETNNYFIPAGTEFTLINTQDVKPGFTYSELQAAPSGTTFKAFKFEDSTGRPYNIYGQPAYSLEVEIQTPKAQENELVQLYPNLPDVTFVDLLKVVSYLTGTFINFNDATNTITFENLDLDASALDISNKIISIQEIKRTFADWSRRNIVTFTHDDTLFQSDYISIVYEIDNDTINAENEIGKIFASEGSMFGSAIYMRNMFDNISKDTICNATQGSELLQRVTLVENSAISRLCAQSTQVEMTVRLALLEYYQIKPNTIIYVNGLRYIWTSRQWEKDVVKFTLAKI